MSGVRTGSRRLKLAARRAAKALMAHAGVTHVTLGEKFIGNQPAGRLSLKVHVVSKGGVAPTQRVPRSIPLADSRGEPLGDIETDVIEVGGCPRALGLAGGHELITHDRDRGTVGLTFEKGGRNYVLTNAHVVLDVGTGQTGGRVDWLLSDGRVPLGEPALWSPMDQGPLVADYAVVEAPPGVAVDLYQTTAGQPISAFDYIEASHNIHWFAARGRIHSCQRPEWVASDTDLIVDNTTVTYREFWQLHMTGSAPQPGMSGACINRTVGGRTSACGLLFGGIPEGDRVFAFQMLPVYDAVIANLP